MKADALWSPQVVIAGVTCGDASYSLGPPESLEPRRPNRGKCSDCKGKGLRNGPITWTLALPASAGDNSDDAASYWRPLILAGPFYFAWGCFRDFGSRPCSASAP